MKKTTCTEAGGFFNPGSLRTKTNFNEKVSYYLHSSLRSFYFTS